MGEWTTGVDDGSGRRERTTGGWREGMAGEWWEETGGEERGDGGSEPASGVKRMNGIG